MTYPSNEFLTCDDTNIADELRVVSGGLPPFFCDGALYCVVVRFYIAVAAYTAPLTALAVFAATR